MQQRTKLKRWSLGIVALCVVVATTYLVTSSENSKMEKSDTESRYADFLNEHPFRKRMKLDKQERIAAGLPPNKYFEQEYLYTADPELLRPTPEDLIEIQEELERTGAMRAAPGDATNAWIERGPNNVGGRTRALMFAPGSTTVVFAGSVTGGLWKNNNITSAASQWQRVNGVPGNLSVTCITVDPNNSNIMYLGTGEVYTSSSTGNGVYKSTDGGDNWFSVYTGGGTIDNMIAYVQDIIAIDNGGTTEVFFGAGGALYGDGVTGDGVGWDFPGFQAIGLYKSTDGTTFTRQTDAVLQTPGGSPYCPNNFDVGADGTLWMGTRRNVYGEGGGDIFSYNGTTWTNVRNLGTAGRIEVAASKQDANKIYLLAQDRVDAGNPVKIFRTTNKFATAPTSLAQPNDADTGISANDFTRGQSFYDLLLGVDPLNDAIVYVGGIDLFKSTNSGNNWTQFSHWYGGFGFQYVHADQHGIAFAEQTGTSTSRVIFGNDGGVAYTNDGGTTTVHRNNGYNVTQFYKSGINQSTTIDKLINGAQDNGVQFIENTLNVPDASTEIAGGDGCWVFVDEQSEFMIGSYVYNSYSYHNMDGTNVGTLPAPTTPDDLSNAGDFVNQCGLDSDANILYSNGTLGTDYQIIRWAIDPSGPGVTTTVLDNAIIDHIPTFFESSPYTNNRILVGTATGRIIRMDNANATPTWTDLGKPGNIAGAVSDIRYGATENDIMMTFHNYGVNSIWYSSNGGTTWVSKEGNLPNIPVKAILQNPLDTNEVIIGTDLGVWSTNNWSDASPTWTQSLNGMSDVKVTSLELRYADNTIVASTYGRGVFTGKFEGVPVPVDCTATITVPDTESFETDLGVWSQASSGDDGDWISFTGATPSTGTGPSVASDGSQYLYIEASANATPGEIGTNATAILNGPCLEMGSLSNVEVTFDYHTFGDAIGNIKLQVSVTENTWVDVFTTPGVSADAWVTETVSLASYTEDLRLRFVGTTGTTWSSDLALDNIRITEGCGALSTFVAGAWDIAPTAASEVLINGNYDTATYGNLDVCSMTISNSATLTIGAGEFIKVDGDITINSGAALVVEHEGSVVQVDDNASVIKNAGATIEVHKTSLALKPRDFLFAGSPMTSETRDGVYGTVIDAATGTVDEAFRVIYLNPENFTADPAVTGYGPYSGAETFLSVDNTFLGNHTTNEAIVPGEGYIVYPQAQYGGGGITTTYDFIYTQGTLNNGEITFPIQYNGATIDNFNLLANPYASAIDINALIAANPMINEVYFWEHVTDPSSSLPGYLGENPSMMDFSMRNLTTGMAAPNRPAATPTRYLASGQGFAIKADQTASATTQVVFNNAMRVTGNNDQYRTAEERELIWLELSSSTYELSSRAALGFTDQATAAIDRGYDSKRMATPISIYSTMRTGEQLGIQAREAFDPSMVIEFGFATAIETTDLYTIRLDNFEGAQMSETPMYLVDLLEERFVNLKEEAYTFRANGLESGNRFLLMFETPETLGIDTETALDNAISLYPNPAKDVVTLQLGDLTTMTRAQVIDVNGKLVKQFDLSNTTGSKQLNVSDLATGVYFVQISGVDAQVVKKLVIQ